MNLKTLLEHYDKFVAEQREVLIKKNSDYAKEGDVFHNFKTSASTTGITPAQGCLNQLCIKTTRLGALMSPGKEVQNESVLDSVRDAFVYSFLLHEIMTEGGEEKNQVPLKKAHIRTDYGFVCEWPADIPMTLTRDPQLHDFIRSPLVVKDPDEVFCMEGERLIKLGTLIIK